MSGGQFLTDEEFARLFIQANTVAPGADVLDIEPRVQAWLDRADMAHRNAFAIAVQVANLARKEPAPAPLPSPAEADQGWQRANREGYGDQQVPTPDEISGWSMSEYARRRVALGVHKDLLSFLGGS